MLNCEAGVAKVHRLRVMARNFPQGTIVVTDGMNGCSLRVSRSGKTLHFYHELSGRAMTGALMPGTVVARVAYPNYAGVTAAGIPDTGARLTDRHARAGRMAMPVYDLITVRRDAVRKIYASAILDVRSGSRGDARTLELVTPRPSKLVVQFLAG